MGLHTDDREGWNIAGVNNMTAFPLFDQFAASNDDRLAADSRLLPLRRANDLIYVDVVRDLAGARDLVFVTLRVSHARKLIQAVRMGHVGQPLP
jgi:hypothetical protein